MTDSTSQLGPPRRMRYLLLAAGLCALAVRVGAIFATRTFERDNNAWPGESAALADSLLSGEGFAFGAWGTFGPSSVQTPPQAGLVALFSSIADGPWVWLGVMLTLALAGALGAVLAGKLAAAWGRPAGVLAAFLVALWPEQILAVCVAQPMAICGALLMLALLFWRRRTAPTWATGSLLAALAGFWMPVLLPAALLGGAVAAGKSVSRYLVLLAAVAVFYVPWGVRGVMVHEPPIFVTSALWQDFYEGNNDHATGSSHLEGGGRPMDLLEPERRGQLLDQPEAVRAERLREWTFAWIKDHPAAYGKLVLVRLGKTLWLDWDDVRAMHPAYLVSRSAWLGLSSVALLVCLWRRWRIGPMLGVLAGALIVPALVLAQTGPPLVWEPIGLVLVAVALAGDRNARDRWYT